MKAQMKCKITAMSEVERSGKTLVSVSVQPKGSIDGATNPEARHIESDMVFFVKPVTAQELKFGQELFLTLSTDAD